MPDAETLVLRFRDLVTAKGRTITEHQDIIKAKKRVLWGWWNKLGEQPPQALFLVLNQKATTAGLVLYLFDSGQELVHTARCSRIIWAPAGSALIASPDPDLTPSYYKDQTYPAWFEFTSLTVLPKTPWPLADLTYVRVDEFFTEGTSRFVPFYGRRMASARELAQQNRTIWFARPAEPEAPLGEMLLAKARPPEAFLRRIVDSPSPTLLWISDTHFSADGHHAFPLDSRIKPTLGYAIENALKDHNVRGLAGVMHTGDLTWKADPSEFTAAAKFFKWLNTAIPLDNADPFSVCPGNHDVAFSNDPASKAGPVTVATSEATAAFRAFHRDFFGSDASPHLSSGRRYLLARAVPVEIVSLNSSLLQQQPAWFQGHGFVGEEQLRDAADQMGWSVGDEHRAYRILMLHHHLMPATYRDDPIGGHTYSVALDAEAIVQWVVLHKVDLVLHGHMHEPFCARVSRPCNLDSQEPQWHTFHVAGMGSTGVERSHLGATGVNTFGVLHFDARGPRLAVYSLSELAPIPWTVRLCRQRLGAPEVFRLVRASVAVP